MLEDNSSKTYRHVNQSDDDGSCADEPAARLQKSGFWRRLGLYNTFLVVLSPFSIFLAIALLVVVWYGSHQVRHGARPPALWYSIHQRKWEPQITTLSSTLIRVSTAAQMGLFASVVAAILLQTTGISIQQLPRMSIIRALNNGPPSHALNVVEFLRRPSAYGCVYCLTIALAIMNSLALQFTSTILLNDFNNTLAVLGPKNTTVRFSRNSTLKLDGFLHEDYRGFSVDYSQSAPVSYPRFAELSEGPVQGPDYMDSGKSLRAFLPIDTTTVRQRLQAYSGPATVLNARTICIRPTLNITNITRNGVNGRLDIEGDIRWQGKYPNMNFLPPDSSDESRYFKCPVFSYEFNKQEGSWPITLCSLGFLNLNFRAEFYSQFETFDGKLNPYLFFNTSIPQWYRSSGATKATNHWIYQKDIFKTNVPRLQSLPWVREDSQTWTSFSFQNSSTGEETYPMDIKLNVSLCFEAMNAYRSNYYVDVEAAAKGYEQKENVLTWDSHSKKYFTDGIRRMFGASAGSLSPSQRGIDLLQPIDNWTLASYDNRTDSSDIKSRSGCLAGENVTGLTGEYGCSEFFSTMDSSAYDAVPHLAYISIFQDILKDTGNPALALQTFRTIILQRGYYDRLSLFDAEAPAQWSISEDVFIPIQWNGFIVIMALLGFHNFLFTVAIVLFWKLGDVSILGNTWLAIAQVMRGETADVIAQARTLTDKEVDSILKSDSRIYKRVKID